jgi:hypothetical protein
LEQRGRWARDVWSKGIGPGRRFDEGGPTAHGPAGGRPPRRPSLGVPRRQSAAGRTDVARREP